MHETVRIVQLLNDNRDVAGTYGHVRDPEVGDTGTVVFEFPAPDQRVTVEMKDGESHTLWFADFTRDELEFAPAGEGSPPG